MLKKMANASAIALAVVLLAGATVTSQAAQSKKPHPKQPPGGANQVEGTHGKVGDMLFTGQWRFQVQSVSQVDSYTLKVPTAEEDYAKYTDSAEEDPNTGTFTPKAGYTFIAVSCLVKNGQKSVQQLDCWSDNPKTAIADDQSGAYTPIAYDMQTKGPWVTKPLIPASGEPITILFAVPPGTKLQSLIVTLKDWSSHTGRDVRVTLTP